MNKQPSLPMGAPVLWQLYRRLLGAELLEQRLPLVRRRAGLGSAVAAALAENLLEGDTLAIAPGDLVTRYLCGMPLAPLHQAAFLGGRRKNKNSWSLEQDAAEGILPGIGAEQAALAVGTALAARLHGTGGITVLLGQGTAFPRIGTDSDVGTYAVERAVALQLPLLFLSAEAPAGPAASPRKPAASLPSIPVDRSDALALYRVIYESAARARSGGGPTRIECCTWAIEHERRDKSAPSALEKIEHALKARKLFDRQQQRQLQQALEREFRGWPIEERG